jgi:hypothetical protein
MTKTSNEPSLEQSEFNTSMLYKGLNKQQRKALKRNQVFGAKADELFRKNSSLKEDDLKRLANMVNININNVSVINVT